MLSGWDFARILKERDIHLPILVMTAAHDAHKWAEEIGASATWQSRSICRICSMRWRLF